jgi:hypothetical protein
MSSSVIVSYTSCQPTEKWQYENLTTDLANIGHKDPAKKSAQNAERARNQEWILASASLIWGVFLGNGKNISADKSANLG